MTKQPFRLGLIVGVVQWGMVLGSGAAFAEDSPVAEPMARLKQLEHLLDQSRAEQDAISRKTQAITEETEKIRNQMIAAANAAQEDEELLSSLEAQLADLIVSEKAKTEALKRRSGQMTGVLTALQRLAWRPTEALLAQPQSPADTVRSAILLRAAVPQIIASAETLKGDIASLATLRTEMDQQRDRIKTATATMEAEHRQLKELYERKAQFQDAAIAAQNAAESRVAQLAAEAQDLRDLMQRIEEDRIRRVAEAEAKEAAEKAAREAEVAARKAAEEAEALAVKARQEAEQAALRAAREQKDRERQAAEAAKEAERRAQAEAREKQAAAQKAAQASQKATREADASRPQSQTRQSFESAKGKILFPARGSIVEQYNPTAEIGIGKRGITIQTRPAAQVIAPYDGQVVFAESFRGYGLLLIIEHSDGYHTLIAGMTRIDAVVGQKLVAGEPVGVMGTEESKPALYVELRHNGQPINPTPWLAAHTSLKVHG